MSKNKSNEKEIQERWFLFEGIIIGIYGNWLINLILLISFNSDFLIIQTLLIVLSFVSLILLLAFGIFSGRLETKFEVIILTFGHFIPICITLIIERLFFPDIFYLFIGGILFFIIFYSEFTRLKQKKKEN